MRSPPCCTHARPRAAARLDGTLPKSQTAYIEINIEQPCKRQDPCSPRALQELNRQAIRARGAAVLLVSLARPYLLRGECQILCHRGCWGLRRPACPPCIGLQPGSHLWWRGHATSNSHDLGRVLHGQHPAAASPCRFLHYAPRGSFVPKILKQ